MSHGRERTEHGRDGGTKAEFQAENRVLRDITKQLN